MRSKPILVLLLTCAPGLVLGAGCSSTGGSASLGASDSGNPEITGDAVRVAYRDYRRDQEFELVSVSHTSKSEQYSRVSRDASTKVVEDIYMLGVLEQFQLLGWDDVAQAGRAPSSGGSVLWRVFEVETADGTSNFAVGSGSSADAIRKMNELFYDYFQMFNAFDAYQFVDNPDGDSFFDTVKPGRDR